MTKHKPLSILIFCVLAFFQRESFAQVGDRPFLGVGLRPEVRAVADRVEGKTGRRIYAVFDEFENPSTLGSSFIGEDGVPYLRVNPNLRAQKQKLEAVIAHELFHLRLRAEGFPVFLFAPTVKTARGLAQDVEQENVNDLTSLIEHRIFKAEMDALGLNRLVDLAGDSERSAERRRGSADGQAEALNFARAVLEYQTSADVENLRRIYARNRWHRAIKKGQEIADLIKGAKYAAPRDSVAVFRLCFAKLYPTPRPVKLTPDASVKTYRQMLISF
ncbi:MAG TPA: hypothetical protein VIL74_12965 [Pyrinomonadaceae bacterium]|jgi:uncharacterized protein involved in tolerance to divalent cations